VVARGGITVSQMNTINDRVRELLTLPTGKRSLIDAVYSCPWHPGGRVPEFAREHPWRKPQPGMILAAASDLAIDLSRSWLIGDGERDIRAGLAAGIAPERCLRIGPGMSIVQAAALIAPLTKQNVRTPF
jgi:histidinol phosphatase-like enzyme